VPVELVVPPLTDVGFKPKEATARGLTVNVAFAEPLYVAVISAAAVLLTGLVVTGNVAVVAPAATTTLPLEGTFATAVLLLDNATTAPPVGAGPLSVTVPIAELPPTTAVGLKERLETLMTD